eukprot:scaffold107650_cov39-Prasinocladus_malaysianus.AAC.2
MSNMKIHESARPQSIVYCACALPTAWPRRLFGLPGCPQAGSADAPGPPPAERADGGPRGRGSPP